MSNKDLRQHMTDFYDEKSVSPATVARLEALANADRGYGGPQVVQAYPGRWLQASVGLAASVALVLSAATFYQVQTLDRTGANVEGAPRRITIPVVNGPLRAGTAVPRYVMVKFQIDGCPLAAGIEPAFCKLVEQYSERPVMLARYDMTNTASHRLSRNMATGLGIDWAYEGGFQSGTILLIDRKQCEVVCTMTSEEQLPDMVLKLDKALQ